MTRFERKNRTDIKYKGGGFFDVLDNAIKQVWRITDEEYDYICDQEGEEFLLVERNPPYFKIKEAITEVNRMVEEYRKSIN